MVRLSKSQWALSGARVFDGSVFHNGHAVVVDGSRVHSIVPETHLPADTDRHSLRGGLLAPGFIDVQVNGGGGVLLNAEPTAEGVARIAASHRTFGTTGLLPTVITDAPDVIARAIAAVRVAQDQERREVLGIHVEGPFIDPARKGAHDARFIRDLRQDDIDALKAHGTGTLLLTVAPNRVAANDIAELARAGILVSLGHAEASFEDASAALAAGATAFTHLFNAMSQIGPRSPGMVGAALTAASAYASFIADGQHVHEAALRVALASIPVERLMLITDAMPSAAGGPDHFELQGRTVRLAGGRLELDGGTLAGSNLTMDAAVRHCVHALGVPIGDALIMASRTPAAFLGRGSELGRIAPGFLASLVHLSDDLRVLDTWVEGS